MKYSIVYLFLIPLLLSCQSKSKSKMINIYPLRPYTYTFKTADNDSGQGENKISFFYTDLAAVPDEAERKRLYDLVLAEKAKIKGDYKLVSIYIYRKTNELNEHYNQNMTMLRAAHKSDLIAYVRWTNDTIDTFFITSDNNVVYDVLEDKKVSPAYEFE